MERWSNLAVRCEKSRRWFFFWRKAHAGTIPTFRLDFSFDSTAELGKSTKIYGVYDYKFYNIILYECVKRAPSMSSSSSVVVIIIVNAAAAAASWTRKIIFPS